MKIFTTTFNFLLLGTILIACGCCNQGNSPANQFQSVCHKSIVKLYKNHPNHYLESWGRTSPSSDYFFPSVVNLQGVKTVNNEMMQGIVEMDSIYTVNLIHTNVDDKLIEPILNNKEIVVYYLDYSKITIATLYKLIKNPNLRAVSLSGVPLTDKEKVKLTKLRPNVEWTWED